MKKKNWVKVTPLRWSKVHRMDESEKGVFLGIKFTL